MLLADGDTTQLAAAPAFKLVPGRWQGVIIERRADEVLVQFAGGPVFQGKHPIYVSDKHAVMPAGLDAGSMDVDNVAVWSVEEDVQPGWAPFLANLPAGEVKVLHGKRPVQLAKESKEAEAGAK